MNKEIEVKVRVSNLDTIRTKLQKIGTFQKKVYQKDVYFVPPGNDFFAQDPVVEFLRIRHQKGKNQLAYHTAGDKGKESEHTKEYEVYINDTETMAQILTSLKFERRFVVEKKREYFQCGEFEIVLDEVKELGSLIKRKKLKLILVKVKK